MQKQRDVLGDTILCLYKKVFPDVQADQIPSIHQIAEDMDCLGTVAASARLVCKVHETLADGLLRLRSKTECPYCLKIRIDDEREIDERRKLAWGPNYKVPKQS